MSYYFTPDEVSNKVDGLTREIEVPCHRCHGTGFDDDDLDCMWCDGMGSNIVRY